MNILTTLSYYAPHLSGLTICAQRLIEGLSTQQISFTALTSQHRPSLSKSENIGKVRVMRVPVLFTFGKVPVMPRFPLVSWTCVQTSDMVWVHVPQVEGLLIALYAKLLRKPLIVTVHCFPLIPFGWQRSLFQWLFDGINNLVIRLADHVVYYTKDYAQHTRELFHDPKKSSYIFPPISSVDHPTIRPPNHAAFIIGFAGRVAEDKGIEYLLEALEILRERGTTVELLIAGPSHAIGEAQYQKNIDRLLKKSGDSVKFLGVVDPDNMGNFYRMIDALVLPSVNRTEAFGIVQLEAMSHGTPVIASNLPGVRIPVRETGFGKIVNPKNSKELADAINDVSVKKNWFIEKNTFEKFFIGGNSIESYNHLFWQIKN